MRKIAEGIIVLAVIGIVVGVISRLTMTPVMGIFASAIFSFSGVCLLLAIALILREK
jgi:hypothetical protein